MKRELEDGWFQHVEMPLPAVLTIQSGINKLRYATLMGIKKAKTKEVEAAHGGGIGRRAAGVHPDRANLPAGEAASRPRCSTARRKKPRRNWWRNCKFEVRVI